LRPEVQMAVVPLSVLLAAVGGLAQHVPRWRDHYERVSPGARQAAARKMQQRRELMKFDPGSTDSEWIVNGKTMDYANLDCSGVPGWLPALDQNPLATRGALVCLPYQAPVSDTSLYTSNSSGGGVYAPSGAELRATPGLYNDVYGYAAPDANGAGPICETYIEGCKYSTEETRKYTASDGTEQSYPHSSWYDLGKDGVCTKGDAATQWLDCGIPCPAPFPMTKDDLSERFGIGVVVFIALCAILGLGALIQVSGKSANYFVAGRSLPLWIVVATLGSQSLDSNAALGNLDLGYNYHWWDGACLPIGLGLSLILNAIFFAAPLNNLQLLTLPDLMRLKFGPAAEVMFSIVSITSFLFLLAGNLVGTSSIITFLFGLENKIAGVWICTVVIWAYTVAGGLFSVAYTDVVQASIGWIGLFVGTIWVLTNMPSSAGVSPAYPLGDKPAYPEGFTDANSYDPIPNAILFNWVTIFVLGFGNLGALDFQARVFASNSPRTAVIGCLMAGSITWAIGIFFSFNSGAIRALYGPSSPHAEFVADSCSRHITVIGCFGPDQCNAIPLNTPTCGEWKPDPDAALKMLTCNKPECHYFMDFDGSAGYGPLVEGFYPMNGGIGCWMLISIVAASMSTGDGAILAMGTVFAHNLVRKVWGKTGFADDTMLLKATRVSTILWAGLAGIIASADPTKTGYLLIVAFDIMLAGCIVPMFAAIYWKSCKPIAATIALFAGSMTRLILEYALSKDGLLLLVGDYATTFAGGLYAYTDFVNFTDYPNYEPNAESMNAVCPQRKLEDWTGVDSLISPFVSLFFLVVAQVISTRLLCPLVAVAC